MSREDRIEAVKRGIIAAAHNNGGKLPIFVAVQIAQKLGCKTTARDYVKAIESSGFFGHDGYCFVLREGQYESLEEDAVLSNEVELPVSPPKGGLVAWRKSMEARLIRIEDKIDSALGGRK